MLKSEKYTIFNVHDWCFCWGVSLVFRVLHLKLGLKSAKGDSWTQGHLCKLLIELFHFDFVLISKIKMKGQETKGTMNR